MVAVTLMAHWQASITREPSKIKAELRQMLAEAVRNTQPAPDHRPKHLAKAIEAVNAPVTPQETSRSLIAFLIGSALCNILHEPDFTNCPVKTD
jgi:hypothetical protein